MGLFSRKSKQERLAEDSGRFYSKDDDAALGERARAKRASSANSANSAGGGASRRAGNDPMLPEKKRARRRLVGAIALALAAAVGLPMLLDSSAPKQLAGDIAIQIPAKDKAAPLPVPAADKTVAAADSVDKDEEVVDAPPAAPAPKAATAAAKPNSAAALPPAVAEPRVERAPAPKPDTTRPERKSEPEHKPAEHKDTKADARLAEQKERDKAQERERELKREQEREKALRAEREARLDKPVKPKTEDKPAKPHEDARALAILEGKPAEKEKPAESAASSQRFVVQVAAMSSTDKAAELQAKLREAGIASYTEKSASGGLIRVRVGPLSRDEAEKVRAKLSRLGMSGAMTPV
jgi:DedD protein